ncbi:MAG: type I-F CRISPR-associated protein Csy1 [Sorangiineae bacterium NIC37A_2]|nr:MAG: type I-F CRISPR-associated protein Csy1 [Sorangiineae bacterium NIC37A_2]
MREPGESSEPSSLREVIEAFIRERLQAKLDKLKPDESEKREELERSYEPRAWLADAARRVGQIQLASHILKPLHPDARGTNLRARPAKPAAEGLLGTHSVDPASLPDDVVGNAAALDVYKFLSLEWRGKSVLEMVLSEAPELLSALSSDESEARVWRDSFASVAEGGAQAASHTLAKQVYFPLTDGSYHLLGPLFPTSLVHLAQKRMREDRYGEAAKSAREARNKGEGFGHGYREYPNLAIQKFGGTKPQNISQLNSERYGENWLLPSLPPNWEAVETKPPLNCDSVFGSRFGRSKQVRELVRTLVEFLEKTEHNNLAIRQYRAKLVDEICDEAVEYAASIQALDPGWSADPNCTLHEAEKHWLDPGRTEQDAAFAAEHDGDWPRMVSRRFADWFNSELKRGKGKLPMSDDEHRQWQGDFARTLNTFENSLEDSRD